MRRILSVLAFAGVMSAAISGAFAAPAAPIRAAGPLVDSAWLKRNLKQPGQVILSVRLRTPKSVYLKGHVPGAVFTNYGKDGWRVKTKEGVAGMLPPVGKLEKLIGSLGIGNDTRVIIVPTGGSAVDMGAATRVYWTFKVLGHDSVSILDGGWKAWSKPDKKTKKPVNPIETGDNKPEAKVFKANLRKEMLVSTADVRKAMERKTTLVDNRPGDFYLGLTKSPAATKAGTIPGSKNIAESWLTRRGTGNFRTKAELQKLYKAVGVPVEGEQITFCNTGHWASLGWFASSEILGNKKARMYDGSMSAWTRGKDLPVSNPTR